MSTFTILGIAFALAMDAFALSIASGVAIKELKLRHAIRIALFFGGFQALMPLIGWLAGSSLERFIAGFDHWAAFAVLALIGCKMIYEALKLDPDKKPTDFLNVYVLLGLSIATSLDALAVGFSLSFLHVPVVEPIIVIGAVTFAVSLLGVLIGDRFGHLFESKIEIAAGLVIIAIGVKILLEHLV